MSLISNVLDNIERAWAGHVHFWIWNTHRGPYDVWRCSKCGRFRMMHRYSPPRNRDTA